MVYPTEVSKYRSLVLRALIPSISNQSEKQDNLLSDTLLEK